MIFAVAACGSVYCTACSVFLCLLLVSDDSPLSEPSESMVARVAVGKFVASLCQAFVPVRCVWREGCPWHLAAPLPPHSWKTTMIRVGGGEGSPLQILSLWSQSHSICSWRSSSTKTSRGSSVSASIAPVFNCPSGYASHAPHSRGYFEEVCRNRAWFKARTWLCTPPCPPRASPSRSPSLPLPVGTQRAGPWPCQLGLCSLSVPGDSWYRAVWLHEN